MTLKF